MIVTVLVGLFAALGLAQTGSLNRPYEPIILTGKEFPNFSNNAATLNQLFLYKYSAGAWTQIPFQFDEVEPDSLDATKTTYFRKGDGKLDDQDELAFMARDAGDKVATNVWINDASSLTAARYEIEVTDPLTNSKGYVYLYRSTTLSMNPAVKDYVTYVAPSEAGKGNDIIKGQSYIEGHLSGNGLADSLAVPVSENGSGMDFLDRLKLRFQVNAGFTLTFTEDNMSLTGLRVVSGPVRIIRELQERISAVITNVDFPIQIRYYGFSSVLETTLNLSSLPGLIQSVTLLRQSFDFAANASGAQWFNQNITTPINVTGSTGNLSAPQAATVAEPNFNWYMLSSPQHGSFVNIFSLSGNLGTTRQFYFHDAASGTNDGTPESGDQKSYGDSGFLATGNIAKAVYNLSFTSYVLGKNQPRSAAETLANQAANSLTWKTQSQSNTVAVQQNDILPQQFVLEQNSPNPFSAAALATVIRYELPFAGSVPVSVRIFNVLGQNVRELVNAVQPAGRYEVQWDGRLANGERAPAGIYFYQLRAGLQTITQKLMVLNR
jgi:hypothetical protein